MAKAGDLRPWWLVSRFYQFECDPIDLGEKLRHASRLEPEHGTKSWFTVPAGRGLLLAFGDSFQALRRLPQAFPRGVLLAIGIVLGGNNGSLTWTIPFTASCR
jgi:hypothetical protein